MLRLTGSRFLHIPRGLGVEMDSVKDPSLLLLHLSTQINTIPFYMGLEHPRNFGIHERVLEPTPVELKDDHIKYSLYEMFSIKCPSSRFPQCSVLSVTQA